MIEWKQTSETGWEMTVSTLDNDTYVVQLWMNFTDRRTRKPLKHPVFLFGERGGWEDPQTIRTNNLEKAKRKVEQTCKDYFARYARLYRAMEETDGNPDD